VAMLHAAEAVAPSLDVQVTALDVHGGVEIERAIATFASHQDTDGHRSPYAALAAHPNTLTKK
jgi:hypothetical protein